MLKVEKALRATIANGDKRSELVDRALGIFMAEVPAREVPSREDLASAAKRTRRFVLEELKCKPLSLVMDSIAPELEISAPPLMESRSTASLTFVVLLGALLGGLMLPGPLKHLGLTVDGSLFLAPTIGAPLFLLLSEWISRHRKTGRFIAAAMGLGIAGEIWTAISLPGAGVFRTVWRRLGHSRLRRKGTRIAAYVAVIAFILLSRRVVRLNRDELEEQVKNCISNWISSLLCIRSALETERASEEEKGRPESDVETTFRRMAPLIYQLHSSTAEELPISVTELLEEARRAGFDGLDDIPVFVSKEKTCSSDGNRRETLLWDEKLDETYDTFGHIDEDTEVVVERPAVIVNGKVVEKGLVRRKRGRRRS